MNNEEISDQERTERLQGRQARRDRHKEQVNAFGRKLRRLRKSAELTQAETATAVGVTPGYIGLLETGKRNVPRKELLDRMLSAYGVRGGLKSRLILEAEDFTNDEDWDAADAQRRIEGQARTRLVPMHQLQTLVAKNLDQLEKGLSQVAEILHVGGAGNAVDLIASGGDEGIVFIAMHDQEVCASSIAQVLARYEAYCECQTWPDRKPTHDGTGPTIRLVVVAPKFDTDAIQIAKHLSLDLKLVRWTALRRPGSEEIDLIFKKIQLPSPDSRL